MEKEIDGVLYTAEKVLGDECDLTKLKPGQRVGSGGRDANFYWLYTPAAPKEGENG